MKKNERGEIATIITIGTLVVIGITTVVSSFFINQKKTVGSQAAVTCDSQEWVCGDECATQAVRQVFGNDAAKWRAEAAKNLGGSCDKGGLAPTISCRAGKYDNAGGCNDGCCASKDDCPGQECDIPNGFCRSGKSCNPAQSKKQTCVSGQCVWQPCSGADCNSNICSSHSDCQTQPPPSGGGGGGGGTGGACFQLSGETYADAAGSGFKFNTHVKVFSPAGGGDGHIQLFVNDVSKGWNQGWNKGANNPFDILPEYTDSPTLTNGQSVTKKYRVKIDECADRGNTAEISCTYSVSGGFPNVTGNCSCATGNCKAAATPPPAQPPAQPPAKPPAKPQENPAAPSVSCTTSVTGVTIPRDNKVYCIPQVSKIRYGVCFPGQTTATETDCTNSKICVNGQCVDSTIPPAQPPAGSNPAETCEMSLCVDACSSLGKTTSDSNTIWKKGAFWYGNYTCDSGSMTSTMITNKCRCIDSSNPPVNPPGGTNPAPPATESCNKKTCGEVCSATGKVAEYPNSALCLSSDGKKMWYVNNDNNCTCNTTPVLVVSDANSEYKCICKSKSAVTFKITNDCPNSDYILVSRIDFNRFFSAPTYYGEVNKKIEKGKSIEVAFYNIDCTKEATLRYQTAKDVQFQMARDFQFPMSCRVQHIEVKVTDCGSG